MRKTVSLAEHPVFGDASPEARRAIGRLALRRTVAKGERLVLGGELCLLERGRVTVTVKNGGRATVRRLREGDLFGAATLFGGDRVTDLTAETDCRLATLSEAELTRFFLACPEAALGYIRFLSDRIRFLNGRIGEFAGGAVPDRLTDYLAKRAENGTVRLPMTRLAAELGIGRTTLYRALESLEAAGKLRRDADGIHLPSERNN